MAETTAVATRGPTPGICWSRAQAASLLAIFSRSSLKLSRQSPLRHDSRSCLISRSHKLRRNQTHLVSLVAQRSPQEM